MAYEQLLDKLQQFASQTLWDLYSSWLRRAILPAKLLCDLFLAQGVILELLGGLGEVDSGSKSIMKAKLPRKDVHHDVDHVSAVNGIHIQLGPLGLFLLTTQWIPVQNICTG